MTKKIMTKKDLELEREEFYQAFRSFVSSPLIQPLKKQQKERREKVLKELSSLDERN